MYIQSTMYSTFALLLVGVVPCALSLDDGNALQPPMGYRTWNSYHDRVTQKLMVDLVDFLKTDIELDDGQIVNLKKVGYLDVGLDDNWQECGAGYLGTFHDLHGTPIVNETRFPNMKKMTDYAHEQGFTMGFYMNNCICVEKEPLHEPGYQLLHYAGDVNSIAEYGFDGVKLDNCGLYTDLDLWQTMIAKLDRPVVIENCHWGIDVPTLEHCPYHFFRSSGDINASWKSIMNNLHSMLKFIDQHKPISRQGCWAYPDMLEVGNLATEKEDRSHFGAWCITSAPLILSFPIEVPKSKLKRIAAIVGNTEAVAVNQAWAGHPGFRFKEIPTGQLTCENHIEVYVKRIGDRRLAIFALNPNEQVCPEFAFELSTVELHEQGLAGEYRGATVVTAIRDVWTHQDVHQDTKGGALKLSVGGRDSAFWVLTFGEASSALRGAEEE